LRRKNVEYPLHSIWSGLTGQHNGNPMISRRNDSAAKLAGRSAYRHRVGVAVPSLAPNEQGVLQQLDEIEESLVGLGVEPRMHPHNRGCASSCFTPEIRIFENQPRNATTKDPAAPTARLHRKRPPSGKATSSLQVRNPESASPKDSGQDKLHNCHILMGLSFSLLLFTTFYNRLLRLDTFHSWALMIRISPAPEI
jgi:hypothetical protein